MKKLIVLLAIITIQFSITNAQDIWTIAGVGADGYYGDGNQATNAALFSPGQLAFDRSGNLYIADYYNNAIRKITKSSGIITTVAGNGYGAGLGTGGYSGDGGQATAAEIYWPTSVVVDTLGNIIVADYYNNRVREVNASTGIISTIAGNGRGGFSGDGGAATAAEVFEPAGVALDYSGNLYIADAANNRIREINASTGIISTIAGKGIRAYSGDGGQATAADVAYPFAVSLDDSSNVYIADWANSRIRKITKATGIITTAAGNGLAAYSGDGGPATSAEIDEPLAVSVDASGNIYIASGLTNRVRIVNAGSGIITTIAGNGIGGYSGDGGPAIDAELDYPDGVTTDMQGNVYISDGEYGVIREIIIPTGIEQINSANNVSIYPNPSNGVFNITFRYAGLVSSAMADQTNLEIYNTVGQNVLTETLRPVQGNNTVNLSAQPDGVYFYKIIQENGEIIGTGKLVINK